MAEQAITKFEGEYAFLSNFYLCPVYDRLYDLHCPSSEHFYQSRKTMLIEEKKKILTLTAGQAKRYWKKGAVRVGWDAIKVFEMYSALYSKFSQNEELQTKLISTYPCYLEEGNAHHDKFWGRCVCSECRGVGNNLLGVLLIGLRKELSLDKRK